MKQITAILTLTILLTSIGTCATMGNWQGAPAGDANKPAGSGNWTDPYWNNPPVALPAAPGMAGYEIKVTKPGSSCMVGSDVGAYDCILSIGGGADLGTAAKVEIAEGGNIGMNEVRVGAGGSASSGAIGFLNQTGGTMTLNGKVFIGRFGTSSTNPNEGKGFYSVSGGTLACTAAADGGMYIGAAGSYGAAEGTFTVAGKSGKINLKKLYVGSDGKKGKGNGTIEFELESDGVSAIKIADGVYLDLSGEGSKAMLVVNADAAAPKADIMLIETEGSGPVTGEFDTVNTVEGTEGAEVVLKATDGSYHYKLTYTGGNGNDIMLKFGKFEPAAAEAAEPNAAK